MESKRKAAVQAILAAIKGGQFSAGDQLPPERELAQKLGLSRNLLREAIGALEALGIVEVKKRLGIFVTDIGFQEFVENNRFIPLWSSDLIPQFYEMRLTIDVRAAELAALRRNNSEIQKMKECLSQLAQVDISTPEGRKKHAHYEMFLHNLVIASSHNTIFNRVFEGLMMVMEKNTETLHVDLTNQPEWAEMVVEHHRSIIQAIERKDPDLAGKIMEKHLSETLERFWDMKAYKGAVKA